MLIFFSSGHSSSPFSVGDPALQTPSHLKFLRTFFCSLTPRAVSDILLSRFSILAWGGAVTSDKFRGRLHSYLHLGGCHAGQEGLGPDLSAPKESVPWSGGSSGTKARPACLPSPDCPHVPEPFRLSSVGLFLSFCPRTSRFLVSPRFS